LFQPLLPLPNQLSKSKRRQSLAEHEAVLAALGEIARLDKTTVMALLREATRDLIRRKLGAVAYSDRLRQAVWRNAPKEPKRFMTARQVARFKRAQREFDQVLLDLAIETPRTIQERNSAFAAKVQIHLP
jgi:hypothetical protein